MQRLGMLTVVTLAASPQRLTDLEGISAAAQGALRKKRVVPGDLSEPVADYVNGLKLFSRYPELKGLKAVPSKLGIEVQDVWLARDSALSATGAMTDTNTHEIPQWAASLGLVRNINYTRTHAGRVVLTLAGTQTVDGIEAGEFDPSPMAFGLGLRFAYLYYLLMADVDFVGVSYELAHSRLGASFTRTEFSALMGEACRHLAARPGNRSGAPDVLRLRTLSEEIDKYVIPNAPGAPPTRGGARPPANTATVRLEPYVDLGLLGKPDRLRYRYVMSVAQADFFEALLGSSEFKDASELLNARLVGMYLRSIGLDGKRVDDGVIESAITDAYHELVPSGGYVSFQEVALFAIARLLERDETEFFEIDDGIRVISEMRKSDPRNVRFGTGRDAGMTFFRLKGRRS